MARRKRRNFTPEQKADAVRLVRQVGSVGKVAKDLDPTETALREWVRQATEGPAQAKASALNAAERKELEQLRRDKKRLETDRDFLKNPQPSLPETRIALRADSGREGQIPRRAYVSMRLCLPQRLLCLGEQAAANPQGGRGRCSGQSGA
jgi:transposase